jgi:hypothetical protein
MEKHGSCARDQLNNKGNTLFSNRQVKEPQSPTYPNPQRWFSALEELPKDPCLEIIGPWGPVKSSETAWGHC